MKFLESNEPIDKNGNVIKIDRLIPFMLDCDACGKTSKMDGGPTGDGKAIYQCPDCNSLKTIKWEFDF